MNKNWFKEIDNLVFPSREHDGIEHIDCSYKEFMEKIRQALEDQREELNQCSSCLTVKKGLICKRCVMSLVPEQIRCEDCKSTNCICCGEAGGYNSCRQTIINNIKTL